VSQGPSGCVRVERPTRRQCAVGQLLLGAAGLLASLEGHTWRLARCPLAVSRPLHYVLRPLVRAGLQHPDRDVRSYFLHLTGKWRLTVMSQAVLALCHDGEHTIRTCALELSARWRLDGADDLTVHALRAGTWLEKLSAIEIAVDRWGRHSQSLLTPLRADPDPGVRQMAELTCSILSTDGSPIWVSFGSQDMPAEGWAMVDDALVLLEEPTSPGSGVLRCFLPPSLLRRRHHAADLAVGRWVPVGGRMYRLEHDRHARRLVLVECRLPDHFRSRPKLARQLARCSRVSLEGVSYVLCRVGRGEWVVAQQEGGERAHGPMHH
jgi:hypothetical protein